MSSDSSVGLGYIFSAFGSNHTFGGACLLYKTISSLFLV